MRGKSFAPMTRLVAASIRQEFDSIRRTKRPAKFPSGVALTLRSLGLLGLDDAQNLAYILHFHHVIHIQTDLESLLQVAGQRQMAHGIPSRNVAGLGFRGHFLRVDVEGSLEDLPDLG